MNWGKMFGKLDPTGLLLGGLSLLGGDEGPQKRQSYAQGGSITDPKQSLYQFLKGSHLMGQGLAQREPLKLNGYVPDAPKPVSIPGLGIQIGGGLGVDPALRDPSLLQSNRNSPVNDIMGQFFGGADQKPSRTAQRRSPKDDTIDG